MDANPKPSHIGPYYHRLTGECSTRDDEGVLHQNPMCTACQKTTPANEESDIINDKTPTIVRDGHTVYVLYSKKTGHTGEYLMYIPDKRKKGVFPGVCGYFMRHGGVSMWVSIFDCPVCCDVYKAHKAQQLGAEREPTPEQVQSKQFQVVDNPDGSKTVLDDNGLIIETIHPNGNRMLFC
jgi:hypothetical protein